MRPITLLIMLVNFSILNAQSTLQTVETNLSDQLIKCGYKLSSWQSDTFINKDSKIGEYSYNQHRMGLGLVDSLFKERHYAILITDHKNSFNEKLLNDFDNPQVIIFIYRASNKELAKQIDSSLWETKEWYITTGYKLDDGYSYLFDKSIDHIHFAMEDYVVYLLNFKTLNCKGIVNRLMELRN